jgi:hypothetical protein
MENTEYIELPSFDFCVTLETHITYSQASAPLFPCFLLNYLLLNVFYESGLTGVCPSDLSHDAYLR